MPFFLERPKPQTRITIWKNNQTGSLFMLISFVSTKFSDLKKQLFLIMIQDSLSPSFSLTNKVLVFEKCTQVSENQNWKKVVIVEIFLSKLFVVYLWIIVCNEEFLWKNPWWYCCKRRKNVENIEHTWKYLTAETFPFLSYFFVKNDLFKIFFEVIISAVKKRVH